MIRFETVEQVDDKVYGIRGGPKLELSMKDSVRETKVV